MAKENIINYREIGQQRTDPFNSRGMVNAGFSDPRKAIDLKLRDKAEDLHRAQNNEALNPVGKILHTTTDLGSQAIDAGATSIGTVFKHAKDLVTNKDILNGNIGHTVKALLGGTLGLQMVSSLLGAPKFISDPASRKQHAPLLMNAGKLAAGATMAYGLLNGVMGGSGISIRSLGLGAVIYLGISFFSSLYNPNSIASRLLSTLGLREKFISLMDSIKVEENFY